MRTSSGEPVGTHNWSSGCSYCVRTNGCVRLLRVGVAVAVARDVVFSLSLSLACAGSGTGTSALVAWMGERPSLSRGHQRRQPEAATTTGARCGPLRVRARCRPAGSLIGGGGSGALCNGCQSSATQRSESRPAQLVVAVALLRATNRSSQRARARAQTHFHSLASLRALASACDATQRVVSCDGHSAQLASRAQPLQLDRTCAGESGRAWPEQKVASLAAAADVADALLPPPPTSPLAAEPDRADGKIRRRRRCRPPTSGNNDVG